MAGLNDCQVGVGEGKAGSAAAIGGTIVTLDKACRPEWITVRIQMCTCRSTY